MRAAVHHIPASLSPAAPLRLTATTRLVAEREQVITGVRGLSWVTLDHDLRDTVLASGERVTVPARREIVVTSLRPDEPFEVSIAPKGDGAQRAVVATAVARGSASGPSVQVVLAGG